MQLFTQANTLLQSLLRSFGALRHAFFYKYLVYISVLNAGLYGLMYYYLWTQFGPEADASWVTSKVFEWVGPWFIGLVALFLLPVTFPLVALLFLDSIATRVEQKHYTNRVSISAKITDAFESAFWQMVIAFVLNILIIPLYFVPVVNLFIYSLLNGYLLGREFFEQIAIRHMSAKEAKKLRKENSLMVLIAGVLIAFASVIPFVNFIAPIAATIFMVHVFHKIKLSEKKDAPL